MSRAISKVLSDFDAVPSGKHLTGSSFIFQLDSDPKPTANAEKGYLDVKALIGTLSWSGIGLPELKDY